MEALLVHVDDLVSLTGVIKKAIGEIGNPLSPIKLDQIDKFGSEDDSVDKAGFERLRQAISKAIFDDFKRLAIAGERADLSFTGITPQDVDESILEIMLTLTKVAKSTKSRNERWLDDTNASKDHRIPEKENIEKWRQALLSKTVMYYLEFTFLPALGRIRANRGTDVDAAVVNVWVLGDDVINPTHAVGGAKDRIIDATFTPRELAAVLASSASSIIGQARNGSRYVVLFSPQSLKRPKKMSHFLIVATSALGGYGNTESRYVLTFGFLSPERWATRKLNAGKKLRILYETGKMSPPGYVERMALLGSNIAATFVGSGGSGSAAEIHSSGVMVDTVKVSFTFEEAMVSGLKATHNYDYIANNLVRDAEGESAIHGSSEAVWHYMYNLHRLVDLFVPLVEGDPFGVGENMPPLVGFARAANAMAFLHCLGCSPRNLVNVRASTYDAETIKVATAHFAGREIDDSVDGISTGVLYFLVPNKDDATIQNPYDVYSYTSSPSAQEIVAPKTALAVHYWKMLKLASSDQTRIHGNALRVVLFALTGNLMQTTTIQPVVRALANAYDKSTHKELIAKALAVVLRSGIEWSWLKGLTWSHALVNTTWKKPKIYTGTRGAVPYEVYAGTYTCIESRSSMESLYGADEEMRAAEDVWLSHALARIQYDLLKRMAMFILRTPEARNESLFSARIFNDDLKTFQMAAVVGYLAITMAREGDLLEGLEKHGFLAYLEGVFVLNKITTPVTVGMLLEKKASVPLGLLVGMACAYAQEKGVAEGTMKWMVRFVGLFVTEEEFPNSTFFYGTCKHGDVFTIIQGTLQSQGGFGAVVADCVDEEEIHTELGDRNKFEGPLFDEDLGKTIAKIVDRAGLESSDDEVPYVPPVFQKKTLKLPTRHEAIYFGVGK